MPQPVVSLHPPFPWLFGCRYRLRLTLHSSSPPEGTTSEARSDWRWNEWVTGWVVDRGQRSEGAEMEWASGERTGLRPERLLSSSSPPPSGSAAATREANGERRGSEGQRLWRDVDNRRKPRILMACRSLSLRSLTTLSLHIPLRTRDVSDRSERAAKERF